MLNQFFNNKDIKTQHTWEIDKLDNMMIKTDDPFISNNIVWKLGITYNKQKETTLNVNLNIMNNPFPDKRSKVYFKKNEFFLPSNSNLAKNSAGKV